MNKLKLFLENFLIYGLGGTISKFIPLIMLPILTRMMPNSSYFGISDMSNTMVSFGSAFATMGMYDAMYRLFFEYKDVNYKKDICSTTLFFVVITSSIVFIITILLKNYIAKALFGDSEYHYLVYITSLTILASSTNSIISAPTRMENKRGIFLVMNTLSPLIVYSFSIFLILKGYFIIALPLAGAVATCSAELIFMIMNYKWFDIQRFKMNYLKSLLKIALPLLPNFLIYWVFNYSDKIMIAYFQGTGAVGLYSVGSKLGHASQLIYTAFAGGWQFFAFSTMKEKDQIKTNSNIFEYLGIISFACTFFVFTLCKPVFQLLFVGEYVSAYIVSPYLFIAPLMQMLFQVAVNQFLIIKKTWPNAIILSVGAICNVILNLWLIPYIGIEGASIATLSGYGLANVICVITLYHMNLMVMSKKFLLSVIVFIIYVLLWRFFFIDAIAISFIIAVLCCLIYLVLYKKEISVLIKSIPIYNFVK